MILCMGTMFIDVGTGPDYISGWVEWKNEMKRTEAESQARHNKLNQGIWELASLRYCPVCQTGHMPEHPHFANYEF